MSDGSGIISTDHELRIANYYLGEGSERKKILVVITDADEIESPCRLKEAILDVKDEGVEIVGIEICTSLMSEWYDRYIEVADMGGFARAMLNLLRDVVKR